jgi:hypothetical protein
MTANNAMYPYILGLVRELNVTRQTMNLEFNV